MAFFLEDKDRKIIPRWRDSRVTISTGELNSITTPDRQIVKDQHFLDKKFADWKMNKTISFATDLMGAAFVLGQEKQATIVANFVLTNAKASLAAVNLAKKILNSQEESSNPITLSPSTLFEKIHLLRLRSHDEPRNSLLWTDLARCYANLGMLNQSASAMNIAINLAPTNRFVLRSAARLYIHREDPQRAHDILRRAETTPIDPWLLAAEIAISSIASRSSNFVKRGRALLESNSIPPAHLTELASAIATLELNAGSNRKARKLFQRALNQPTENSVAQAEWASRRIDSLELDPNLYNIPRSFEARAWKFYTAAEWSNALQEAWKWLEDQPFSSRPALLGSYLAGTMEDYSQSEHFARSALIANPNDPILRNNLVFALASSGRIKEAEEEFRKINRLNIDNFVEITLLATEGLLQFRRGHANEGRDLYHKAMEKASGESFRRIRAAAAVYLAREEFISNSPHTSKALELAFSGLQGISGPDLELIAEHLRKLIMKG